MTIGLGMAIHSSDGRNIGAVDGFVFAPGGGTATAVIVGPAENVAHGVVVPLDALRIDANGRIDVDYTADQIARLPHRGEDTPGAELPLTFGPGLGTYFPLGAGNFGLGLSSAIPMIPTPSAATTQADQAGAKETAPPAAFAGSPVVDRNGETIGDAHHLAVDTENGHLTRLVVREGLIFTHETPVPPASLGRVEGGVLHLTVDADSLAD